MVKIQEYDLKIKPMKSIKGRGITKLMDKGNEKSLRLDDEMCTMVNSIAQGLENKNWYQDMIYYLKH